MKKSSLESSLLDLYLQVKEIKTMSDQGILDRKIIRKIKDLDMTQVEGSIKSANKPKKKVSNEK